MACKREKEGETERGARNLRSTRVVALARRAGAAKRNANDDDGRDEPLDRSARRRLLVCALQVPPPRAPCAPSPAWQLPGRWLEWRPSNWHAAAAA